jgi:ferrous iron transport protein B
MASILLVGKPNTGKSSLFNQLTGLNQKVGNYAGVTVDLSVGNLKDKQLIDIPGLQSLVTKSPEEIIAKNRILASVDTAEKIIFVANGTQLMDSLLLFTQIADLQIPLLLVVNFADELKKKQYKNRRKRIVKPFSLSSFICQFKKRRRN